MIALCIDAGTSLVKCVAFDEDGRQVAVAARQTEVTHPVPGANEQDMDGVWAATCAVVREVAAGLGDRVGALALTAQGDGCWLVDDDGRPTGPAVLWNDARATPVVDAWDAAGLVEEAFRRSGSVANAGVPHAILAFLREHEPARVERAATVLTCGGWLFAQLTGERVVDVSEASNPWMRADDPATSGRDYGADVLALHDLEWIAPLLPELVDGERRVAPLGAGAAEALGLPKGLDVVLAPYDIVATAIGVGATSPDVACSILGTTLCTQVMTPSPDLTGVPSGMTLRTGIPGRDLRSFGTLAGTEVIDWAVDLLGLREPAELSELAAAAQGGRDATPVLLPYLSPAGERAPIRDPAASGALLGLRLGQGREELARAIFDGLALVVRDCLEAADVTPHELRVCGGGSASDLWCSLIADVCAIPVVRTTDAQCGAKGAQVAARVALGRAPDADTAAAELVHVGTRFEPDGARHEAAQAGYERFVALRESAREGQWPRLHPASAPTAPAA